MIHGKMPNEETQGEISKRNGETLISYKSLHDMTSAQSKFLINEITVLFIK